MELYTPCHSGFIGYCRGLTGNRDDAQDLASETVLIVYENLEKLRKVESFKAYLFGVARRLQLHYFRRSKFIGKFNEKDAEKLTNHEHSPEISYDVEILYRMLNQLPSKQREAIVLFEISGFSLEEIRQLQGGTLSGVKSRIKRAREQLRLLLDPNEYEVQINNAQSVPAKNNLLTLI